MLQRIRILALLAVLVVAAVACGQKEGVHVASGGGGGLTGEGSGFDAGTGDTATGGDLGAGPAADPAAGGDAGTADPGAGGGAEGGGTGGETTAGGDAGGGSQPSEGGGQAPAAPAAGGPAWGPEVVIGVHAPITGAAPLPASFKTAAQLYPSFINAKGGINGRKLKVVVANDEYRPATAVQRCQELVQQSKAFLLVGGGGTDQIQACGRYAESAGVPYLSAGVTENGLRGLKGYFAVSMSYAQQGPMLANFIKKEFKDRAGAAAMIYSETPNFVDARDAFVKSMGNVKEYRLARTPSATQLATTAQQLCTSGIKVAYPLMAPADWLKLLGSVRCDIQWVGVGLTMGLNTVANTGCKSSADQINGAIFFSPFPGIDKAPSMDPEFAQAVKGKSWDDIYVALWATTKPIGELVRAAGKNLTRAGFVQAAEGAKNLGTGLNPPLSFSPDNHFGASQVHVLQAVCSGGGGSYKTIATFARY